MLHSHRMWNTVDRSFYQCIYVQETLSHHEHASSPYSRETRDVRSDSRNGEGQEFISWVESNQPGGMATPPSNSANSSHHEDTESIKSGSELIFSTLDSCCY